jgi:hypothetical protein
VDRRPTPVTSVRRRESSESMGTGLGSAGDLHFSSEQITPLTFGCGTGCRSGLDELGPKGPLPPDRRSRWGRCCPETANWN